MDHSCSHTNENTVVDSYSSAGLRAGTITTNAGSSAGTMMNRVQGNQTIIGVFDKRSNAETAVSSLRQQGFSKEEINIISKQQGEEQSENNDDDILDGTLTGGTIGGIGGLLLGAGALMIPGIGPIIAAGPIAGAIGGAIAGGIAGGLIDWGIPADESQHYQQEVLQGGILAIIRTDAAKVNTVAQILRQNGAKDVKSH